MNEIKILKSTMILFLLSISLPQVLIAQVKEIHIDSLSIKEAVNISFENNPLIKISDANVNYSKAGLRLSQSAYFPEINITGAAQRTEGAFVFNPSFPPRDQKYNNYTMGIQLQQMIYDFGRTSARISANKDFVNSSLSDFNNTKEDLIMTVEINYYTYLQSLYLEKVDEEALSQTEKHLKIAEAFYKAGTQPEYDVTKAQVDVANAKLNLIHSQNQVKISKLQLENSMGVKIPEDYTLTDSLLSDSLDISVDSLKSIALNRREDLKSLKLKLEAQKSFVSSVYRENLPSVSAFGNYNWNGFEFPLQSRWTAGINVSIPVFEGFSVSAQIQQAESEQKNIESSIQQLTLSILSDVQQDYLSVIEAENTIAAAKKLVLQAEENFRLAESRYKSGVGSATEITDAQLSLSKARYSRIKAYYDYVTSIVRLKRSADLLTNG